MLVASQWLLQMTSGSTLRMTSPFGTAFPASALSRSTIRAGGTTSGPTFAGTSTSRPDGNPEDMCPGWEGAAEGLVRPEIVLRHRTEPLRPCLPE